MIISSFVRTLTLTLLTASLLSSTPAAAASESDLKTFVAANGGGWAATWSADGSQIIALRGGKTTSSSAKAGDVAAKFIRANSALLGLARPNLKLASERSSLSGTHYTYVQVANGLPVFEGAIDIHVNAKGQVFLVTSNAVTDADAATLNVAAGISPSEAVTKAEEKGSGVYDKTGANELPLPAAATPVLGLLRLKSGARLVYAVKAGPITHYVDAATGAIVLTRSAVQSATGRGKVFIPNPTHTLDNGSLTDQNNANYPALGSAYFIRDLKGIKKKNGRFYLRGPHVKTTNHSVALLDECAFWQSVCRPAAEIQGEQALQVQSVAIELRTHDGLLHHRHHPAAHQEPWLHQHAQYAGAH